MVANSLLYIAINFAGMYTKYLTDRGQRLAFIETHKAMEHKKESEKEYQKTQRLLDSSELNKIIFTNFKSYLMLQCINNSKPHKSSRNVYVFALHPITNPQFKVKVVCWLMLKFRNIIYSPANVCQQRYTKGDVQGTERNGHAV
jgi:hypothetical protein